MMEGARVHTTLPAMDIERAKAFYTKKVGATSGDSSPGGTFLLQLGARFSSGTDNGGTYQTDSP